MTAYYNEHDPQKAAWLRELIKAGMIAPGEVDERDIQDVLPNELIRFTQCHFFAGIGIWSYALRSAGWPDSDPVWTGSCPCQPFSEAGQRKGTSDERHLWPAFFHLIRVCKPHVVFGEQVAKKNGLAWLDTVQTDLEAEAYAVGALAIPACGFGAPHKRERLFFVADATGQRHDGRRACPPRRGTGEFERSRNVGDLANSEPSERWPQAERRGDVCNGTNAGRQETPSGSGLDSQADEMAGVALGNTGSERLEIGSLPDGRRGVVRIKGPTAAETGIVNGVWRDAELILCNDPDGWKWRGVEPGSFPLAHGASARVLRLRGYGDGIVAPVAEEFIRAYLEVRGDS